MAFKDHFSRQAEEYERYRPRYPSELAAHIAAQAPARTLALDVATGNGQAALDLAEHFELVLASDASAGQLKQAKPHARIRYLRHTAERLPVASGVADVLVAAQAAHWFDFPRFYAEAARVLKPRGLVALFTYELPRIEPRIDAAIDHFYRAVVGRYWPAERRYVEEAYRTLPFPLAELAAPSFAYVTDWGVEHALRYVGTWSAVDRCRLAEQRDPIPEIAAALKPLWPTDRILSVRFPIHLRLGRVSPI